MREIQAQGRNAVKVTTALNLIWYYIGHELNLDKISRSCNVSKFHFHRIFLEHQGESLGSYIARKRIERAANRLILFPYYNISQISSSSGYSTPANFSKAFNKYIGISPKQWRNLENPDSMRDGLLNSKYGKVLDPYIVYSRYNFSDKYERLERLNELDKIITITKLKEIKLMCLSTHVGINQTFWGPVWEKINRCATRNLDDNNIKRFGVWYDNMDICPKELMRYDAAISIPETIEVNAPYVTQKMETGYYATGKLCGTPTDIRHAVKDIYMFWLLERGYIPDCKPYHEEYLADVNEDGHYQIQFYIKLKSNRRLSIN